MEKKNKVYEVGENLKTKEKIFIKKEDMEDFSR